MTGKRPNIASPTTAVAEELTHSGFRRNFTACEEGDATNGRSTAGSANDVRNPQFIALRHGDCLNLLPKIEANSVHLTVTDPPYFIDGLDSGWRKGRDGARRATGTIGGLPVGMKFDPRQGIALQSFIARVGKVMAGAMKPGAFAVVFSQPRLTHRMAIGLEDAGFEIRDLYAWRFTRQAQSKAFTLNHFVDRMNRPESEREAIKNHLGGRKTPQLRPQFEAMILAQKPREGTFVENWMKHETGLIDTLAKLDGKGPTSVMTVEKPSRDQFNSHLTVKPLTLIEHLIQLFSLPGQIVLDPFLGSGTTALAAKRTGRSCIGIEINEDYLEISKRRLGGPAS